MGSGQFMEVWKDAWIPDTSTGKLVVKNNTSINEFMVVAESIEVDSEI